MGPFLNGAIIAAGRGERLRAGSNDLPKPLVTVAGMTLLERQIRALLSVGVGHVGVIVNLETARLMGPLPETLAAVTDLCVADTPNSMESLLTLGPKLGNGTFLLATVDSLMPAAGWRHFAAGAARVLELPACHGVLGITRWRGEARALFADLDADRKLITGLTDDPREFITAGVYAFRTSIFDCSVAARQLGLQALRRFLAFLINRKLQLAAIEIDQVIDIDVPADLAAARRAIEDWDKGGEPR